MKQVIGAFLSISLCLPGILSGQIEADKKIQLTGSGDNAKIEGIQRVVFDNDAASKKYVDTTLANLAGGGSNMVFSFASNKSSLNLPVGTSTSNDPVTLTCKATGGDPSVVSLKITGAPSGVTWSMSPGGGFPDFQSTQIFFATSGTTPGSYPVAVTASGGVSNQQINITLNVLPAKRAYITSSTHMGDFGGIASGDAICQNLANTQSLGGTWLAWLADGNSSSAPSSRFTTSSDPYYMLNGTMLASNWSDLTDNAILLNFTVDETASVVTQYVRTWTNVTGGGARFSTNEHCSNWTSTGGVGRTGVPDRPWNADWTGDNAYGCNALHRLYCFEQ